MRARRESYRALTVMEEMELVLSDARQIFRDDEERRKAWLGHRETIMSWCSNRPGVRPWAWWKFEAGYDHVPYAQAQELIALGAVDDEELRGIHDDWDRLDSQCHQLAKFRPKHVSFEDVVRRQRAYWGIPLDRPMRTEGSKS